MVTAGGGGVHDELAQLKSLREKKGDFESSCKEVDNVEKKTQVGTVFFTDSKILKSFTQNFRAMHCSFSRSNIFYLNFTNLKAEQTLMNINCRGNYQNMMKQSKFFTKILIFIVFHN